jgi:transposase, IS5 family
MTNQKSFTDIEYEGKKRTTKREKFLNIMEEIIPWDEWVEFVRPYYPKGERGRPPKEIETMLRMYLLQVWYSLSDEMLEDSIYDSQSMRRFVGINFLEENVPDATTLLKFRHMVEENGLSKQMFDAIKGVLVKCGRMMKEGTIVDATLIDAPSSTKNIKKERDPEMKQTKKGNQWYFGFKSHVGVDAESGLIHSVETTAANVHDVTMTAKLLHGEEKAVYGDSAYLGAERHEAIKDRSKDIKWNIALRRSTIEKLPEEEKEAAKAIEHVKASIRAKVENPFHIIKNIFGFRKTRYRGIAKNQSLLYMLYVSANLLMCASRGVIIPHLYP